MSNFSNLLALSMSESDKTRNEALSRAAQMRMKQKELQRDDERRKMEADQFAQTLGFKQQDAARQRKHDEALMKHQSDEAKAERENRLGIANVTAKTRQDIAGTTGEYGIAKARVGADASIRNAGTRADTSTADRTSRDTNVDKKLDSTEGIANLDRASREGVAKGHDDTQLAINDRNVHVKEAGQALQQGMQDKLFAHQLDMQARSEKSKDKRAHAHNLMQAADQAILAATNYDRAARDPLAKPEELKDYKAALDQARAAVPSLSSAMLSPETETPAEHKIDPGERGEPGEPAGVEGPKGNTLDSKSAKEVSAKLFSKDNKYRTSPVTTLKGLKGKERDLAQEAYKEQLKEVGNPQEVYDKYIAAGAPPEIARQKQAEVQGKYDAKAHVGEPKATGKTEKRGGKDYPTYEGQPDWNYMERLQGGKYGDTEGTFAPNFDPDRLFGARIPDAVPFIGGSDVLPGDTKPFSGRNLMEGAALVAGGPIAQKLGAMAAPVASKLAPYAGAAADVVGGKLADLFAHRGLQTLGKAGSALGRAGSSVLGMAAEANPLATVDAARKGATGALTDAFAGQAAAPVGDAALDAARAAIRRAPNANSPSTAPANSPAAMAEELTPEQAAAEAYDQMYVNKYKTDPFNKAQQPPSFNPVAPEEVPPLMRQKGMFEGNPLEMDAGGPAQLAPQGGPTAPKGPAGGGMNQAGRRADLEAGMTDRPFQGSANRPNPPIPDLPPNLAVAFEQPQLTQSQFEAAVEAAGPQNVGTPELDALVQQLAPQNAPNPGKWGGAIKPQQYAPGASSVMNGMPSMKLPPDMARNNINLGATAAEAGTQELGNAPRAATTGVAGQPTRPSPQSLASQNADKTFGLGTGERFGGATARLRLPPQLESFAENAGVDGEDFAGWLLTEAPTNLAKLMSTGDPKAMDLLVRNYMAARH